ncbi:MAG: hypothetical protein WD801_16160 [Gemmatimonadaceae bacterium]
MRPGRSAFLSAACRKPLAVLLVMAFNVLPAQAPPTGDSTSFFRALALEDSGKYREAAALFRQALSGPSAVSALLGLERSYAEIGWTDSLLAPLDTMIRANPHEAIFRAVQLRSLQTLGRDTDLTVAFERWTQDVPRDPRPYREYARLLLERGLAQRADSVLLRARAALGATGDLQLEIAQTRAAMGQWEESAAAWRAALASAPYLEQAAGYALTPAPTAIRDAIRAQFFAPPLLVAARRALATLEAAWGSPANGWLALRDLPPDSTSAAAWLDFAGRAEAEERWTHAREALSSVLRWRASPEISLRAAIAALNSGDPAGALAIAPLTADGADSARVARTLLPVHVRALAALGRPATAERLVASYDRWLTPTSKATLARSIAFGWVRIGDMTRARGALRSAGPEADSSDAAGWLALYTGDLKSARKLLRSSGDASPELALALALIARIKDDTAVQLGQAFLTLARGDTARAATALLESIDHLPTVASLLLYTAAQLRLASRDEAGAVPLWTRVVQEYASSAEAPAAELEWARSLRRGGDRASAAGRLEHLILTYPGSALVPQARRDLELLRNTRGGAIRFPPPSPLANAMRSGRSRLIVAVAVVGAALLLPPRAAAQHLVIPMDDDQRNHLKAYGLTYHAIKAGMKAEWLLNYRGGSFLLPDTPELRRRAGLDGISLQALDQGGLATIRGEIAGGNMDAIPLEKAPRVAVYTPPDALPWDDAVTLALKYAGIEYTPIYDVEVQRGDLANFDWLHLHHEDFTGQMNKFHLGYRDAPWFVDLVQKNTTTARVLGFSNIPELKKSVAEQIRQFVERGGFLFAMCGATETLELAMAGAAVDLAGPFADGTPMDQNADARMEWKRSFAFQAARIEQSPFVNSMSSIDGHQVNVPGRRQPLGAFTLFNFSAKFDPVAAMLVQGHRTVISDFYGVTTSFNRSALKPNVTVLAFEEGAPWVKYVHGDYGKGTWTYYGGHDPEDPQHAIGSPPTDLSLHRSSPGYRLILNNVLFPAAKKKPLKT